MSDEKPLPSKEEVDEALSAYDAAEFYGAEGDTPALVYGKILAREVKRLRTPTPAREDLAKVETAFKAIQAEAYRADKMWSKVVDLAGQGLIALRTSPPSKSEAEIRAETWEEAAGILNDTRGHPGAVVAEFWKRARALRAGEART